MHEGLGGWGGGRMVRGEERLALTVGFLLWYPSLGERQNILLLEEESLSGWGAAPRFRWGRVICCSAVLVGKLGRSLGSDCKRQALCHLLSRVFAGKEGLGSRDLCEAKSCLCHRRSELAEQRGPSESRQRTESAHPPTLVLLRNEQCWWPWAALQTGKLLAALLGITPLLCLCGSCVTKAKEGKMW